MEKTAMFAGGCFWCMVEPFEKLIGVKDVRVGYSGGTNKNPTFEDVCQEDIYILWLQNYLMRMSCILNETS